MAISLPRLTDLLAPPLCWGCGGDAGGQPLCAPCRVHLRRLGPEPVSLAGIATWAPLAYEGAARDLVRGLKYRGAVALADPMAAQIAASAPPGFVAGPSTLVPVPLHPARLRRRGFNQAERLATALARRTRLAVCDCLERHGPATRQVGRDRAQRLAGPVEIAHRRGYPVPARVVLVDDVATTGATLAACAAVLRARGTRICVAVAFARTPGR